MPWTYQPLFITFVIDEGEIIRQFECLSIFCLQRLIFWLPDNQVIPPPITKVSRLKSLNFIAQMIYPCFVNKYICTLFVTITKTWAFLVFTHPPLFLQLIPYLQLQLQLNVIVDMICKNSSAFASVMSG